MADGRNVDLSFYRSPALPSVILSDALRLRQIITNLVHNAAKFTPEGGQIQVGVTRRGDSACISITDNGIGIPAQNLDNIFDLFSQNGATSGQYHDGLGIGLAICRSIIEYHEGRLFFEPRQDGGSVFGFTLPPAEGRP